MSHAVIDVHRNIGHHEPDVDVGDVIAEQKCIDVLDAQVMGRAIRHKAFDMGGMNVPARHTSHDTARMR